MKQYDFFKDLEPMRYEVKEEKVKDEFKKKMEIETKVYLAERYLKQHGYFDRIDGVAYGNQRRVLDAFRKYKVSDAHFCSSSGYGYDDKGREDLDKIYAYVFECEAAIVRHNIISGTHALAIGLYGLLRPGDTLFSVTGKPYDTLEEVIGIRGDAGNGSLKDFGVKYKQMELNAAGQPKTEKILAEIEKDTSIKVVFIQRSKGYSARNTLSSYEIGYLSQQIHKTRPDIFTVVDNCYGEFCDDDEPTKYGVDLVVGSLIKNPGGGMAETGGYFAGTQRAIDLVATRLTCPGIGLEGGATLGQNKNMYKGLFYAPHTVAQSLKTALLASKVFLTEGYVVYPRPDDERHCIIQTISLGSEDKLLAFCKGIQQGSPVDSYVVPEAWQMPGYDCPVVMAAGAFTQGSSIELSADAPCKEPYTVYMQGGLTYESGKIGIIFALESLIDYDKAQKKKMEEEDEAERVAAFERGMAYSMQKAKEYAEKRELEEKQKKEAAIAKKNAKNNVKNKEKNNTGKGDSKEKTHKNK